MLNMERDYRYIVAVPTLRSRASVGLDYIENLFHLAEKIGYSPVLYKLECHNSKYEQVNENYNCSFIWTWGMSYIKNRVEKFFYKLVCAIQNRAICNIQLILPFLTRLYQKLYNGIFGYAGISMDIEKSDKILIIGINAENFAQCIFFAKRIVSEKKCCIFMLFDDTFHLAENFSSQVAKYIFEELSFEGKCLNYTESEVFRKYFINEFALPIRDGKCLFCSPDGSPEQFLLSKYEVSGKTSPARPLIFYSLKNLSSPSSGSSLRFYLLVRYLKENFCNVSICIPKQNIEPICESIYSYDLPETVLDKITFILHKVQQKLSLSRFRDAIQLIAYTRSRDNRDLRRQLSFGLSCSDSLFVEHILYLDIVRPMARLAGIPIFVTLYDDDSNRCYLPIVKKFIKKVIIGRLKSADAIATVEKKEHDMLEECGLKNYLIPSTADTLTFYSNDTDCINFIDSDEYNILFVGSNYYPNIEAKKIIFELAKKALMKNFPWKFVIVGGCATPAESHENVKTYGVLNREELAQVYSRSSLLISPLVSGVGAAVKAIEGLGTGKPFLGTSITFRGLDVHDGQECFVEDDIDNFISRIHAIYTDQFRAESVGLRGKALARQYDFRNIFVPYLDFAQISSNNTGTQR